MSTFKSLKSTLRELAPPAEISTNLNFVCTSLRSGVSDATGTTASPEMHPQPSHIMTSRAHCPSPANSHTGHTVPHTNTALGYVCSEVIPKVFLFLWAVKLFMWAALRHPSKGCLDKYNEHTHMLYLRLCFGAVMNSDVGSAGNKRPPCQNCENCFFITKITSSKISY